MVRRDGFKEKGFKNWGETCVKLGTEVEKMRERNEIQRKGKIIIYTLLFYANPENRCRHLQYVQLLN